MSWKERATPVEADGGGWKSRAEAVAAPEAKGGAGQAALESFGNAATMGYLPHIQALAEKVMPSPGKDVDADLLKQGFTIESPKEGYVQSRDANIKRQSDQKNEHPIATTAGTVAGILGGGLMIPGSMLGKGATLGKGMIGPVTRGADIANKAWNGAKAGAAMGAIMNPGDVEGDVSLMPMERAKNAALGGMIGGLVPPAIDGVKWVGTQGADWLKTKAAEKAFRSLGRGTPQSMQKMVNSGENVAIGRELLDEGAIPVLGTPGRIAKRVGALKEKAGEEVGALVKGAGSAKLVDAEKIGVEILDSPELALMRKTPGMESAVSSIEKQVETLSKNGMMDLGEAQALRQQIDKSIKWNKATPDVGAAQGLKMQRTGIRDGMNEGINQLNPGAPKDQLLTANRKYGHMATADDVLQKELARNQSNRAISLTDTIAGAAGASAGSPGAALILGAINKAGRTFGNSMQARGYDAIAKTLAKSPSVVSLAEKSPGVVARLAANMGQQATGGAQNYSMQQDELLKDQQLMKLFQEDPRLIDGIEDPKRRALIKDAVKRLPANE
jgi:hypothetical protein